MAQTLTQLIANYAQKLTPVCPAMQDAQQEIWWFLEHVTHKRKAELLVANPSLEFLKQHLDAFITERVDLKKPLQYILGSVPFGNLTILVQPPILIPRPETEEWTLWLIDQYNTLGYEPQATLDLCTGSGCIGLALARAFPHATVLGTDINPHAIALAEKNKAHNNIANITFKQGDLFEPLEANQTFDLIVSNPPYLDQAEWEALDQQVLQWEDKQALMAQNGGMGIYQRIFANVTTFLSPNSQAQKGLPRIVMEIGPAQAAIEQLAIDYGFAKNAVFVDTAGKRRWITLYV